MISPSDQSPDSALPHTPDKRLPEFPSSSSSSGEVIQEMGVPEAKRRRTTDEAPATTRAQAAVSVRQPMPLAAARPLESYFNRSKNVSERYSCMVSLTCPMKHSRISVPVRGEHCDHLQPFCMTWFVEQSQLLQQTFAAAAVAAAGAAHGPAGSDATMTSAANAAATAAAVTPHACPTCGICGKLVRNVVMDPFMDSVLTVASEDTKHINVFPDGRFEELNTEMLMRQQSREEKVTEMRLKKQREDQIARKKKKQYQDMMLQHGQRQVQQAKWQAASLADSARDAQEKASMLKALAANSSEEAGAKAGRGGGGDGGGRGAKGKKRSKGEVGGGGSGSGSGSGSDDELPKAVTAGATALQQAAVGKAGGKETALVAEKRRAAARKAALKADAKALQALQAARAAEDLVRQMETDLESPSVDLDGQVLIVILYGPAEHQLYLEIKRRDLEFMDKISDEGMTTVGSLLHLLQMACRPHGWVALTFKYQGEILHPLDFVEESLELDTDPNGSTVILEAITMPATLYRQLQIKHVVQARLRNLMLTNQKQAREEAAIAAKHAAAQAVVPEVAAVAIDTSARHIETKKPAPVNPGVVNKVTSKDKQAIQAMREQLNGKKTKKKRRAGRGGAKGGTASSAASTMSAPAARHQQAPPGGAGAMTAAEDRSLMDAAMQDFGGASVGAGGGSGNRVRSESIDMASFDSLMDHSAADPLMDPFLNLAA